MSPASQPESESQAGDATRQPLVQLSDVVAARLGAQRKLHLDAGWAAFRAGDYQQACSEFSQADGYSSVGLLERLEARVSLLYARLAVEQYAEAIGCLEWILGAYSRTDAETQDRFAALIPDLPSRYGRRSELNTHLDTLGGFVARRDNAYKASVNVPGKSSDEAPRLAKALMEAKCLQLMVLYAVPEQRSRAVFEAKALVNLPKPWDNLSKLLSSKSLDQAGDARTSAVPRPAADFPFNIFKEGPPLDAAVPPPVVP